MPLDKHLNELTEVDIDGLVQNKVAESRTIDYKEALPGNSDSDRKEFLADVSSFANASGGQLVFGVRAPAGIPESVTGLGEIDADAAVLRLESMTRDGLDPRVPGLATRAIPRESGGPVIVMQIPKSWAAPHMVNYQLTSRFFSRSSAGKHQLDIREIRAAFLLSEGAAQRIRNFRADRLGRIVAGETPVALPPGAKVVLHVIPLLTADDHVIYDVRSIPVDQLPPLNHSGWNHRHNFDGVLTFAWEDKTNYSYLQVFNHGAFEAVDWELLGANGGEKIIPSASLEWRVMEALGAYLGVQRKLGIQPPVLAMLTLVGVKDYILAVPSNVERRGDVPMDRDSLVFPDLLVEDYETDPSDILKPVFDMLWNAAGFRRCLHYDSDGKWKR